MRANYACKCSNLSPRNIVPLDSIYLAHRAENATVTNTPIRVSNRQPKKEACFSHLSLNGTLQDEQAKGRAMALQVSKVGYTLRHSVRYGSSVPGPVEARRRSTSRRMGDLAISGGFNGPKDIGVFMEFGNGWQDHNGRQLERQVIWQPPNLLHHEPRLGLPSWLLQDQKLESYHDATEPNAIVKLRPENAYSTKYSYNEKLEIWKHKLQGCSNVATIRDAATPGSFSSQTPEFSCEAFQRLSELDLPLTSYFDFLQDPILNSSRSLNALSFLRLFHSKIKTGSIYGKLARRGARKIQKWVTIEVSLGTLSEEEICTILRSSLRNCRQRDYQYLESVAPDIYSAVWEGIKNSLVRGVGDVRPATLRLLLQAAAQSPDAEHGRTTAYEIVSRLQSHGKGISSYAIRIYTRSFLESPSGNSSATFQSFQYSGRSEVISQFLESLPSDLVFDALASMILRLLHRANSVKQPLCRSQFDWLQCYLHALTRLGLVEKAQKRPETKRVYNILERKLAASDPKILAIYFKGRRNLENCEFLLDHWYIPKIALSREQTEPSERAKRDLFDLRSYCAQNIQAAEANPKHSPYLTLVEHLFRAAPSTITILVPRLMILLQHLSDSDSLSQVARGIQRLKIHIPLSDLYSTINYLAPRRPKEALSLFRRDPRPRLEHCQPLAAAVVASSIHNNVLFSLLSRPKNPIYNTGSLPLSRRLVFETFTYDLACMLSRSEIGRPWRALRIFKRIFPGNEPCDISKSPPMTSALVHAGLLPWLRLDRTIPLGIKRWVFQRLEDLKGKDATEEIYEVVKLWEQNIMQRRKRRTLSSFLYPDSAQKTTAESKPSKDRGLCVYQRGL